MQRHRIQRQLTLVVLCGVAIAASLLIEPWIHPDQAVMARQPQAVAINADSKAIQQMALKHLNSRGIKPNAAIAEVAQANGYALVGWIRGEMAGNTLLKRKRNRWNVVTSGGGSLGVQGLVEAGVPKQTAEQLMDRYDANWRKQ
ncbi:hypothetical protein JOY44_25660 (plasmid) [Phormidium sp. CLA17]|uniref:hypothetical protein n=1 Tax=Leptolyngbya sp. Cla-17 TaxID=2803751 RepID=UPI001492D841|nr:hypothetical protein [Leptolyngbya sp. Cla-17]MBM0744909.1 hypothetical protein [Leptolyngbya sp. Cla-17]